jgi:SAM-dependent methyltransferase
VSALRSTVGGVIQRLRGAPDRESGPASGHELAYWRKRGLAKGTYIYDNYLRLWGLSRDSFAGAVVADYGSGPFGGVLSALEGVEGHPIDVLAAEYNEIGVSPFPIQPADDYRTPLPDALCDACFCANALDHDPHPRRVAAEIARILKPRGALYLHVHHRREDQLNKAHRYVVTEEIVRSWLDDLFEEVSLRADSDWPNDEPDLTMLYGKFLRRAV